MWGPPGGRPGDGPEWLRPRNYGAAPGEHLLRPSLASSLFPQLPPRSRTAFRVALLVVLLALVTFATLRMPACLISVAALGLPLLFLLYLHETDARRDLPWECWSWPRRWALGSASDGCC